jgi:PAS domain S-box-containing protein
MEHATNSIGGIFEDSMTSGIARADREDDGSKASILIVDDNEANLTALEAILRDLGQDIVRARSGSEALRLLFDRDFAVVLLDVRMPDMDGFETAELIRKRQRSRHTPIILITAADVSQDQIARGYSVGAVDYIFKPFLPEVLKAKVTIFLELFKKSQEIRESEIRLRTLIANVPGAVYRRQASPPWDMLFLSESIEDLSGYPASDFVERRRPFASIVHPDDERASTEALAETVRRNGSHATEYRIVHRSGRVRWVIDRSQCVVGDLLTPHIDGILFEVTERKVAEEALHELVGRLVQIQDDERRQIARELHDNTSPLLTGLTAKLYNLKHRGGNADPMAAKFLDDSLNLAEKTVGIIRDVSYLLHPRSLEETGLLSALRSYVSGFSSRTGIAVAMTFPEELPKLPPGAEIALFRVVQENLTNILHRSSSGETKIRLFVDGRNLVLEVSSEGSQAIEGISEGGRGSAALTGIGIAAMRERLRQFGGRLEITRTAARTAVAAVLALEPGKK